MELSTAEQAVEISRVELSTFRGLGASSSQQGRGGPLIETGVHCPAVEDEHRRRVHVRTRRHTRRDPRETVQRPRLGDPAGAPRGHRARPGEGRRGEGRRRGQPTSGARGGLRAGDRRAGDATRARDRRRGGGSTRRRRAHPGQLRQAGTPTRDEPSDRSKIVTPAIIHR